MLFLSPNPQQRLQVEKLILMTLLFFLSLFLSGVLTVADLP